MDSEILLEEMTISGKYCQTVLIEFRKLTVSLLEEFGVMMLAFPGVSLTAMIVPDAMDFRQENGDSVNKWMILW